MGEGWPAPLYRASWSTATTESVVDEIDTFIMSHVNWAYIVSLFARFQHALEKALKSQNILYTISWR